MRSRMFIALVVFGLTLPTHAAPPASVAVVGSVASCDGIFCLTLTATSDAAVNNPSAVMITVPVRFASFITDADDPCYILTSGARAFVLCELIAWKAQPSRTTIRLTPVQYNGAVWIYPGAYIFDPANPIDLVVEPVLVPVPFHTYTPVIHR